jgi:hypothetical protein
VLAFYQYSYHYGAKPLFEVGPYKKGMDCDKLPSKLILMIAMTWCFVKHTAQDIMV